MKVDKDFQSVFTSMVDTFPSCKMSKTQWAGIETWMKSRRFLLQMANHLFFTARISTNDSNSIFVHFYWVALTRIANTRQPVASKVSYKHDFL